MSADESRFPKDPERTLDVPFDDDVDRTELEPLNGQLRDQSSPEPTPEDEDLEQTLIEVPRESLRPPDPPGEAEPRPESLRSPEPPEQAVPPSETLIETIRQPESRETRPASETSPGEESGDEARDAEREASPLEPTAQRTDTVPAGGASDSARSDSGSPSGLSGTLDSSSGGGAQQDHPVLRTVGLAGSPIRGKLIRRLGGGGFGEVFEVDYADCLEAWKFIPKERTQDNAVSEEVRNAMRLCRENPSIVKTFGVHVDVDQKHWIIRMERVPGRDLHRIVQEEGILGIERVVDIGRQIADALHFSHTQFGIVHQDIKPKNLIWDDTEDSVRISDFGISVSLLRSGSENEVRGTPVYMAPEQLAGEDGNDGRVDQWAFGITLYFLLTGRLPFDVSRRRRRPSIVYEEMRERGPVPLGERLPILDPELGNILARCFAWDPADRFESLGEVSAELARWWQEFPHGSDPEARAAYRAGQAAFSDCRFDDAKEAFGRVLEMELDEESVLFERARRGRTLAETTASDLEDELEAIRGVLEAGDLSEAYQRLIRIEPRFSRSRRRHEMIERLEVQILQRWEHARPEVKRLVELTEFSRASHYVRELRQFLDHRSLKWKLLGSDASRDETGTQTILNELDDLIDERQADFCEQFESMEAAIEQQRFRLAQEELGKLQNRFPQRKNDFERFGEALARAVKNRQRLEPLRIERLREIRAEPSSLKPGERLDFAALIQACGQFLEDFPPERYESMLGYARLRDELSRLRLELGETVREGIERARDQGVDLKAARDIAAGLLPLVRQTDLLSLEEASEIEAIVSRFETRHELCREREEQARASLEARRWDQALIQLEECERLGPDDPETISALIRQARHNGLKARELEDRLRTQRYNLLSRTPEGSSDAWHGYLQEIVHYLYDARELTTLQDEDSAARTRENARLVFLAPLDPVRRELEQAGSFVFALEILQRIGMLVHDGAPRFQTRPPLRLVCEDGSVHERLVELFEAFACNLRERALDAETLALCESLIEELTPWAELLHEIELPERHPIVVLSRGIRSWDPPEEQDGQTTTFEERCRLLGWQEQIIRSLVVLGPPSIQLELQSIADSVAADRRREVGSHRARRLMRIVRRGAVALALMAIGGAAVWFLRDRLGKHELGQRFEALALEAGDWMESQIDELRSRFDQLEETEQRRLVLARLESLAHGAARGTGSGAAGAGTGELEKGTAAPSDTEAAGVEDEEKASGTASGGGPAGAGGRPGEGPAEADPRLASASALARLDAWIDVSRRLGGGETVSAALRDPMRASLTALWRELLSLPSTDRQRTPEERLEALGARLAVLAEMGEGLELPAPLAEEWRTDLRSVQSPIQDLREARSRLAALLASFERLPPSVNGAGTMSRSLLESESLSLDPPSVQRSATQISQVIDAWPRIDAEGTPRARALQAELHRLSRAVLESTLNDPLKDILGTPGAVSIDTLDRLLYYHRLWNERAQR